MRRPSSGHVRTHTQSVSPHLAANCIIFHQHLSPPASKPQDLVKADGASHRGELTVKRDCFLPI